VGGDAGWVCAAYTGGVPGRRSTPRGVSHGVVPVDGDYLGGAEPSCPLLGCVDHGGTGSEYPAAGRGGDPSLLSGARAGRRHSAQSRTASHSPLREDRPPRVLTKIEYEQLRHVAADDVRTAALIELILQTGMSLGELSRLTLNDVTLPSPVTMPGIGSVRIAGRNTSHGLSVQYSPFRQTTPTCT